jgi:EamA domain-containing membrane protein RarD
LFFKAIQHVFAAEVMVHRILWSASLLLGFIVVSGRLCDTVVAVRDLRTAARHSILQHTMPTITFLIAVSVYGEPLCSVEQIVLGPVWLAALIHCADTFVASPCIKESRLDVVRECG